MVIVFYQEIYDVLNLWCDTQEVYILIIYLFIFFSTCRINILLYVSISLAYYMTRTSRAWEVHILFISIQHLAPSVTPSSLLPSLVRTPRVSRARTRAKLRGNGCLCDRGGWAARSERRAAWVCNVRHVGHGVLNRGGTAEPNKKRDRQRATETRACPALFALLRTRACPQPTGWLPETVTDSSMRTRGRPAVIPSR